MDEKKLDEILKNTRQTNIILETIGMTINSCFVVIVAVIVLKILRH